MLVDPRLDEKWFKTPFIVALHDLDDEYGDPNPREPKRIETGIYQSRLNFNHLIQNGLKEFSDWDVYGVADNIEQVKEYFKDRINDPDRKFCLAFTKITKATQPVQGGWRWHKWGQYIGTQEPIAEHIYDEPKIEEVIVYHLYELLD